MSITDPAQHSVEAAELLPSLLDEGDQFALLTFDKDVKTFAEMTLMSQKAKSALAERLRLKSRPRGSLTNLHAALSTSRETLLQHHRADAQMAVILLTDGKMDVGNTIQDQRLIADTLSRLIPDYRSAGIKLYALAFSTNADLRLLKQLSLMTGGFAELATSSVDLHKIFERIFEVVKGPDMLPITGDSINVSCVSFFL